MDPQLNGVFDKMKLSQHEWDDTKPNAPDTLTFLNDMADMTRLCAKGHVIQDFLDVKCRRESREERKPQWVDGDPDLRGFF